MVANFERRALAACLAFWTAFAGTPGFANPKGGVVRGGSAQITGEGTGRVDIFQQSNQALLSWDQFNIEKGETTTFHQPSADAVAINRTLQADASRIFGNLVANGHVYLINPNGFLFGREATVNTRAFLATTTADGKKLAERYGYDPSAQAADGAKIENLGRIESGAGGFIYLIAPSVENGESGVIVSPEGEIEIAAGATVYLTDRADGRGLAVEYTAPAGGEAVNLGHIVADGGLVRAKAALIQQAGTVEANSVQAHDGVIELVASDQAVLSDGSVTAARGGSDGSDAGQVTVLAGDTARVDAGARIDASASGAGAKGGSIEVSADHTVELGGALAIGGGAGGKGGELVVDPAQLLVNSATQVAGSGSVVLAADDLVSVGATISLAGAGDPSEPRQSLTLRSGGQLEFQPGAAIREDGDGSKVWDVALEAGDVHLLGNGAGVQLTDGDLSVRTTGNLVLEDGSELSNVRGNIDVDAGDSVLFRARQNSQRDTVIQNGSGDIHVVAENDVRLQPLPAAAGAIDPDAAFRGDAAIRTRGVTGTDADGNATIGDGGSILVWAKKGSVDAGLGNRWLEPGPNFGPNDPLRLSAGLPPGPDFDPMPVVRAETGDPLSPGAFEDGVLGIGTEAGGDVTVIAGQNITTRNSNNPLAQTGGTATGGATSYDGAHIGSFGVPVSIQTDSLLTGWVGAVDLPNAPASHVTLVAGGNLAGNFSVRNGVLTALAGYSLPAGTTSVDGLAGLSRTALRSQLEVSAAAQAGNGVGWVGSLHDPITFEIAQGSVDALGANGVSLRTALNPSLALPPQAQQALTYGSTDSLRLEAETGDVLLIGNDIAPASAGVPLAAILPPTVEIVTHAPAGERAGDVVLVNDFMLAPSPTGNLSIDAAGKVRTANPAASSDHAVIGLTAQVGGTAIRTGITIPAGTRVRDPETGIVYTLTKDLVMGSAVPERAAHASVQFQADPKFAETGVTIPAGVQVVDGAGNVYVTQSTQTIPPIAQRVSRGMVRVVPAGGVATTPFSVSTDTNFVAADGTVFRVTAPVDFRFGDKAKMVPVEALVAGVDAPAGGLQLQNPSALPVVASATNLVATSRPASAAIDFVALEKQQEPIPPANEIQRLLTPVDGAFVVPGAVPKATGGRDVPVVTSEVLQSGEIRADDVAGPAGLVPAGHTLELVDTGFLPVGIAPGDVTLIPGTPIVTPAARPVVFRNPADPSVPDPAADTLLPIAAADVWMRNSDNPVARILQSDAAPVDLRSVSSLPPSANLGSYLYNCRSGVACSSVLDPTAFVTRGEVVPIQVGTGPLHTGDATRSTVHADGGIERVAFTLAESASVTAGPRSPAVPPTVQSDIIDLELTTQNLGSQDVTLVSAPYGDIAFGSRSRQVLDQSTGLELTIPGDSGAGVTVFGPGTLSVRAGVLDDGTASGLGGRLELSDNVDGVSRGVSTAGNLPDRALPEGGASIDVLAAGDIALNRRGSIAAVQGGDITIESLGGGLDGGAPENFTGQRGIVALYVPQGSNDTLATGGGDISVDVFDDFDIGKSAIATLAGGDVTIKSEDGSISGGTAQPFGGVEVVVNNFVGFPTASYSGGGIFSTGKVSLDAHKDIDIGAGITGASIAIAAGGNVNAGSGAINSSGNVNIDVGGSISGSISAGGSVVVTGGSVASGSSIAAGGLVSGAGSVGSNTGAGRVSSETSLASNDATTLATGSGVGAGSGSGGPPRSGVMVEVSSTPEDVSAAPCEGDHCPQ